MKPLEPNFESVATEKLREAGFRITKPRLLVVRALSESNRALGAYAIHELLVQQGDRTDVVSVYRTLSVLVELGLAHHLGIVDGFRACCFNGDHGTVSQHFICNKCGNVNEIHPSAGVRSLTDDAAAEIGFESQETRIEVLGHCAQCK
ncbi:MAG: transcriptional repressor [Armatimonadetes bacterium]|nr:transcriptional repressor [Armatimonadota bacterium]